MYGYKIINKETAPVFESKYTMTIPSRTQDVEFTIRKMLLYRVLTRPAHQQVNIIFRGWKNINLTGKNHPGVRLR